MSGWFWIAATAAAIVGNLFAWALCRAAAEGDRIMGAGQ